MVYRQTEPLRMCTSSNLSAPDLASCSSLSFLWKLSKYQMSHDMRKPVFAICKQQRRYKLPHVYSKDRSSCTSMQLNQCLHYPQEEDSGPWLPTDCLVKTVITLHGCTGWSSDQLLYCSLLRYYNTCSFYVRNFKPLASSWSCAGWFELPGRKPQRQVFSWHGSNSFGTQLSVW